MDANAVENHLVGVELQLVELVEQQNRAEAQGELEQARALQDQIDALHREMAATAESIEPS
jgi:hypothetical protein